MASRYIYLSDELNNLLKEEDNASGLIQSLLMSHFKTTGGSKTEVIQKLEQIEIQKAMTLKLAEQEKEKLLAIKHGLELKETEIEMAEKKGASKILKFRENAMKNFKDLAAREMTDAEFLEFEGRFELNEKGFNIFKFVEEKNGKSP